MVAVSAIWHILNLCPAASGQPQHDAGMQQGTRLTGKAGFFFPSSNGISESHFHITKNFAASKL